MIRRSLASDWRPREERSRRRLSILERRKDERFGESSPPSSPSSCGAPVCTPAADTCGVLPRYHVHEKVQNFMIPIEANGWHDEQTDELFASLLGRSFPVVRDEDEEEVVGQTMANSGDVGALRIFG